MLTVREKKNKKGEMKVERKESATRIPKNNETQKEEKQEKEQFVLIPEDRF